MEHLRTIPALASSDEPCDELYEQAINMAADAFHPLTDEHVKGVYDRLAWNACHGLGRHGATTVH